MDVNQNHAGHARGQEQIDFHGASIIDQNGQEKPITEEMIQKAFSALIKAWEHNHDHRPG